MSEEREKKQDLNFPIYNLAPKTQDIQPRRALCILTLGCPKNIVDSENIADSLKNTFELTEDVVTADVILLNTCGFIKSAIDETFQYIDKISKLKKKKPGLEIVIYGCAVTRLINENFDLKTKFPLVDKFIQQGLALDSLSSPSSSAFKHAQGFRYQAPPGQEFNSFCYVKISDGCNRKCSFCTIPSIKGRYVSVPKEVIIEQTKKHIAAGKKEIILIGQETTNYGVDINSSLYELVDELSLINGLQWLRIMYAHPISFDLRILELMYARPNICKYIDIPLQHIDNDMLTVMGRAGDQSHILELIDTMRKVVPTIAIRSTFITGFPGETTRQHKELLSFLANTKLARVGVFKYSKEAGTAAATLAPQINEKEKKKRFDELMILQQNISLELNKQKIGHTISVLIEADYDKEYFVGRSEFDAPDIDCNVFIKKHRTIEIGDIVSCYVFDAEHYSLKVRKV